MGNNRAIGKVVISAPPDFGRLGALWVDGKVPHHIFLMTLAQASPMQSLEEEWTVPSALGPVTIQSCYVTP